MFLTNFSLDELGIYRRAISTWHKGDQFEAKDCDHNGLKDRGSLHYYGNEKDLGPFWRHFETLKYGRPLHHY